MKLDQLTKVTKRSAKRLGRGLGSGKGKTSGRGMKGQKARGNVPVGFIGGTLPLYKKLPYKRGLGNPKRSPKPVVVPVSKLLVFKSGAIVDIDSMMEKGLASKKALSCGAKIMGEGEINIALTVKLPATKAAVEKIEKAGGTVIRE